MTTTNRPTASASSPATRKSYTACSPSPRSGSGRRGVNRQSCLHTRVKQTTPVTTDPVYSRFHSSAARDSDRMTQAPNKVPQFLTVLLALLVTATFLYLAERTPS